MAGSSSAAALFPKKNSLRHRRWRQKFYPDHEIYFLIEKPAGFFVAMANFYYPE